MGPRPGDLAVCEETFSTLGEIDHGYVFDVDARATSPVDPVPLTDMGRFVHEAVAVDPDTGIIYETEDRGSAGFYRFLANVAGDLVQGGRLQMLKIKGRSQYDTRTRAEGREAPAGRMGRHRRTQPRRTRRRQPGRPQPGLQSGCGSFARLEGCWYGHHICHHRAVRKRRVVARNAQLRQRSYDGGDDGCITVHRFHLSA